MVSMAQGLSTAKVYFPNHFSQNNMCKLVKKSSDRAG